jgi:spermidine dehydrogenase
MPGLLHTFVERRHQEEPYIFHFPDGNASLARLLVSRLVPKALPGPHDMHTIGNARVGYDALDEETGRVRVRLNSTVVRLTHDGPVATADEVKVAYLRDGRMHQVRGTHVILACYNAMIPKLVPELPASQKEALAYSVKVPMLYTNVLLRRWTAFKQLGVASISAPGMYHPSNSLDPGTTVGGYRGVTTPDEPIVVHMVRNPNQPGLPRKEQNRIGQQELRTMKFEDFELSIRRQLARMLAGTDFDPAADIVGMAVNRWPDGYSYTYDTLADPDVPPEQRPHVIGRERFGRIAIANSDAGAAAFTNQAFDEGHRAVQEILVSRGLA